MQFYISSQKQNVILETLKNKANSIYSESEKNISYNKLPANIIPVINQIINSSGIDHPLDLKDLSTTQIQLLLEFVENLPEIHLILSFEPTIAFIESIEDLISEKSHENTVVKFKVDSSIIAGAIIEFKGKSYDYSLEKYISQIKL